MAIPISEIFGAAFAIAFTFVVLAFFIVAIGWAFVFYSVASRLKHGSHEVAEEMLLQDRLSLFFVYLVSFGFLSQQKTEDVLVEYFPEFKQVRRLKDAALNHRFEGLLVVFRLFSVLFVAILAFLILLLILFGGSVY